MPCQLRDNVHWCDCAGKVVFLDVQADRYLGLPKAANDAFLRLAAHDLQPGDEQLLRVLVASGVLINGQQRNFVPSPPRIECPARDFLTDSIVNANPLHVLRALVSEMRASWLLRTRSFREVTVAATKQVAGWRPSSSDVDRSLEAIVAAFSVTAILTRAHNRCLVRALAVHALCKKRGFRTKLVFGVIAHPFAAHCWVQLGSTVLIGGFELARLYTPIAVLE